MGQHKKKTVLDQNTIFPDYEPPIEIPESSEEPPQAFTPLFWHECSFSSNIFISVMLNLIRNPNINSTHLFRADILYDDDDATEKSNQTAVDILPRVLPVSRFDLQRAMVRRLIPRNPLVDNPLDQTCLLYTGSSGNMVERTMVVYIPHIASPSECPFYHPAVKAIAFLHTFMPVTNNGIISTHFLYFPSPDAPAPALERIGYHLLATVHKHGHGLEAGYEKRVVHDTLVPQAALQNTYTRLKSRYAKTLIENWAEVTDPLKHVFEDLCIAAFLIELWKAMYPEDTKFPGFVDIGCGNGLLVHILIEEGYEGWGFDARKRKSWATYSTKAQENLKELVLIPSLTRTRHSYEEEHIEHIDQCTSTTTMANALPGTHSGEFLKDTFIISNHADELTPWTPILAHLSSCPFIAIPCCSHNLTGARFRAPTPKSVPGVTLPTIKSAYACLIGYVQRIADVCGFVNEVEMLRIPSTRNTAIIGRNRKDSLDDINIPALVEALGGTDGWEVNAMKLVKGAERNH